MRSRPQIAGLALRFLILLTTLVAALPTDATTVIVVWTPTAVFIGSDSLAIGNGKERVIRCKLQNQDAVAFVFLDLSDSPTLEFMPSEYAKRAIREGGDLAKIASRFEELTRPSLAATLTKIFTTDPTGWDKDFRGRSPMMAVFVTGDPPSVFVIEFRMKDTSLGPILTASEYVRVPDSPILLTRWNCYGVCASIKKRIADMPTYYDRLMIRKSDTFIRELIKLEMADAPEVVGGSVNILRLDAKGLQWTDESNECRTN